MRLANYLEAELQNSQNPFALICLAVQYANLYRDNEEQKFNLKRGLIKMLRKRAYSKDEIIELLEFIDDALHITDTMKNRIFDEEAMNILEEDHPMAYVSGFRQRAINQGKLEGKLEGLMEGIQGMLEIKFGGVPSELQNKMHKISDLATLELLKEGIKRATDFEQVRKLL